MGYPLAVAVIVRWLSVVREQRIRWFAIHAAAVAAIVAGWVIDHRWSAVAINGTWLVISVLWFVTAGRRQARSSVAPPSRGRWWNRVF